MRSIIIKSVLVLATFALYLATFTLQLSTAWAQSPEKLSYQSVVRNSANVLLSNTQMGVKISIIQGTADGTAIYSEVQTPTTNVNGLFSIEIGSGAGFDAIDWASGPYFIKTEIDPAGGTNYTISGTTQLLSVPYALYAKRAGNIPGGLVIPKVSIDPVTDITSNSATFHGSFSGIDVNQVFDKGIMISTSPNPTIRNGMCFNDTSKSNYMEISQFWSPILCHNTTYYVRSYVQTENEITYYSNVVTFKTLTVGQEGPSGGYVFFDKGYYSDGWRYLEAAPTDQSTGAAWGCVDDSLGNTYLGIGTGKANTEAIVAACAEEGTPARICADLVWAGQSDWFLPSARELLCVKINLKNNGIGNFSDKGYWSSTEYCNDNAYLVFFDYDHFSSYFKKKLESVRAVRAF